MACSTGTSFQLKYIQLENDLKLTQNELTNMHHELIKCKQVVYHTQLSMQSQYDLIQLKLTHAENAHTLANKKAEYSQDLLNEMRERMLAATLLIDRLLLNEKNRFFKQFYAKLHTILGKPVKSIHSTSDLLTPHPTPKTTKIRESYS